MAQLFTHMGWEMPGETTTEESFETKLKGGNFVFTAKEKLTEMEIDIAFVEIKNFTYYRFEIKGKKKKGFRRELRFDMSFQEQGAAGKMESYLETVGPEGMLKIRHYPQAIQNEMDLSSDEQRHKLFSKIEIVVYGTPAPQGSKKFVGTSKSGHGIMVESSKAVKPWREAVKFAALEVLKKQPMIRGPVTLVAIFTIKKPASAPRRTATYPDRKPDLSKLIRSTEDALTDAGCWEDDARIVRVVAAKVYPGEGDDALNVPGAVIRISGWAAYSASESRSLAEEG